MASSAHETTGEVGGSKVDRATAVGATPLTREDWIANVSRADGAPVVVATTVIAGPTPTMSRAFKVGCDDDQEYWIKTLEGVDPSQRASLVLEQVVGRVGLLLGVAVVPPHLVRIPVGMDFPELGNGRAVLPGVAHASVSFSSVVEKKAVPDHRGDDDNKRRHAGIFALADLARGSDPQYLYDTSADNSIFSHDHGLYACNTGQLDVQAMVASVDQPGMSCGDPVGLDTAELERLADRLGSIAESEIAPILNLVPSDWPVSDEQLGTLGWFLFERAANVAVRLRGLMP